MSLILLAIEWADLKGYIFGGGAVALLTGIAAFYKTIKGKEESEVQKDEAESAKLKAEAYETKTKADISIMDAALKLAQRLGEEADMTKKQLSKVQNDLDIALQALKEATIRLDEERRKNEGHELQIAKLKEEIEKLKKNA
jgi:mannitol-1-phosphate/altronate dehydrogenase